MTIVTYVSGAYAYYNGTHSETVDILNSNHVPAHKIVSCVVSGGVVFTLVNIGGRSRPI